MQIKCYLRVIFDPDTNKAKHVVFYLDSFYITCFPLILYLFKYTLLDCQILVQRKYFQLTFTFPTLSMHVQQ